jgi:hypothetical protein
MSPRDNLQMMADREELKAWLTRQQATATQRARIYIGVARFPGLIQMIPLECDDGVDMDEFVGVFQEEREREERAQERAQDREERQQEKLKRERDQAFLFLTDKMGTIASDLHDHLRPLLDDDAFCSHMAMLNLSMQEWTRENLLKECEPWLAPSWRAELRGLAAQCKSVTALAEPSLIN